MSRPFAPLALVSIVACLLALPASRAGAGALAITRWTVDGGGLRFVQSGPFVMGGTIGQPDAGLVSRLNYVLVGGFWVPGAPVPVGVDGSEEGPPGVPGPPPGAPLELRVYPAAPNPFAGLTSLAFDLPDERHCRVNVFDLAGAHVATLADGRFGAGHHRLEWRTRDARGRSAGPGLYLLRVELGAHVETRKLVILH